MSDDPTVDLKKRARRRLVGAAALALLAVIVLPIVMDSEPKPIGQEIQIRIPNRDGDVVASRVIPAVASTPSITQDNTPMPALPPPLVQSPPAVFPSPAGQPIVPIEKPVSSATTKPKTEAPAAKAEAVNKSEAAHAVTALTGKSGEQWVVSLGAYQNSGNVKLLVSKLTELRLSSFTEQFDSPQGSRTRVRAGPFKSRDDAERARMRIKKIGVDGVVLQKE